MPITRSQARDVSKDLLDSYKCAFSDSDSGPNSRTNKETASLAQDALQQDHGKTIIGFRSPPQIINICKEPESTPMPDKETFSLKEKLASSFQKVTSIFGYYLTASTATVLIGKTLDIHPILSAGMNGLALFSTHTFLSKTEILGSAFGILMGLSDLGNSFSEDDIRQRFISFGLGTFLVLASHLAFSKEKEGK